MKYCCLFWSYKREERPVRRVQIVVVAVLLGCLIVLFAPNYSESPFPPVQHNQPELVAPTPGFDPDLFKKVVRSQNDCWKAGQPTQYGINASLCGGVPNGWAALEDGTVLCAEGQPVQASSYAPCGVSPLSAEFIPGVSDKTNEGQVEPFGPSKDTGRRTWPNDPLRFSLILLLALVAGFLFAAGVRKMTNNEALPTAEPKQ
jgi:hypothetical protein